MKKELILGAGSRVVKDVYIDGHRQWENPITLDNNPAHKPDVLFNLNDMRHIPLPFPDDTFDEIHAYEVLEHLSAQGDYEFFFREFSEYARILKPGGIFCGSVPNWRSPWAFGDPSHTRVILPETLTFLSQEEYAKQVGVSSMSDFRYIYKADFKVIFADLRPDRFLFALKAIKG